MTGEMAHHKNIQQQNSFDHDPVNLESNVIGVNELVRSERECCRIVRAFERPKAGAARSQGKLNF